MEGGDSRIPQAASDNRSAGIATSKYVTKTERDMLWADIYAESALPKEYGKNPSYVKAKIKRNKKILEERRRKGKDKNGNYSITVPLKR